MRARELRATKSYQTLQLGAVLYFPPATERGSIRLPPYLASLMLSPSSITFLKRLLDAPAPSALPEPSVLLAIGLFLAVSSTAFETFGVL